MLEFTENLLNEVELYNTKENPTVFKSEGDFKLLPITFF